MNSLEPITLAESKRLCELEAVVKRGQESFIEVGEALLEIRDAQLYRADYKSFDAYCKGEWGWGQKRASQIIVAASAVKMLPDSTNVEILPVVETERAARELAKVEPEGRRNVLKKAAASGKVTAKSIKAAAEKSAPAPIEKPAPLTDDAKKFRLSLKIQDAKTHINLLLTGLTNLEMMKFADSLKQMAKQIEATVAKNQEDIAA